MLDLPRTNIFRPRDLAVGTSVTLGTIFPIFAIVFSMNLLLVSHQVHALMANWIGMTINSKITFLLVINILLLFVGCALDMMSAIVILAPLLVSLERFNGIDPVQLDIVMIINLEIGLLTPPMGISLIVALSAFREKFGLVVKSVLPFVGLMLAGLFVVTFFPSLSLALL